MMKAYIGKDYEINNTKELHFNEETILQLQEIMSGKVVLNNKKKVMILGDMKSNFVILHLNNNDVQK